MTCVYLCCQTVLQIRHTNEHVLLRPSGHNGVIRHYIPQLNSTDNLHSLLCFQVQLLYFYTKNKITSYLDSSYNNACSHSIPWQMHYTLNSCIRMEALRIMSTSGSLKVAGVLVSVGGTMIISLYRGKVLHLWSNHILHHHNEEHDVAVDAASHHRLRGTILLAGSSFMLACWYLIQVTVLILVASLLPCLILKTF